MAINVAVAWDFRYPTGQGWTENYYFNAASASAAIAFPQKVINDRLAFLHTSCNLQKIRAEALPRNRNVAVRSVGLNGTDGGGPSKSGPDEANISALFKICAAGGSPFRHIWFRGLTDNEVTYSNGGIGVPTAFLSSQLRTFVRDMVALGWLIQFNQPITGIAPNIYQTVTAITGAVGSGVATINFLGSSIPAPQSKVLLGQLNPKLYPGLNGIYTVLSSAANQFTIAYNLDYVPPATVTKGRWRPYSAQYVAVSLPDSSFLNFATRNTGLGFPVGRGRKRSLRLRSL
jgi:hypothetical protein